MRYGQIILRPSFVDWLGFRRMHGLALVTPVARKGWLLPRDGLSQGRGEQVSGPAVPAAMPFARAWTPYLLLAALLVATRLDVLPLKGWLQAVRLSWTGILGTDIGVSVAPLYLPGAGFLAVALAAIVFFRMGFRQAGSALRDAGRVLIGSALALGAAVPMVRVFIQSA